jgi:hypothetical protein
MLLLMAIGVPASTFRRLLHDEVRPNNLTQPAETVLLPFLGAIVCDSLPSHPLPLLFLSQLRSLEAAAYDRAALLDVLKDSSQACVPLSGEWQVLRMLSHHHSPTEPYVHKVFSGTPTFPHLNLIHKIHFRDCSHKMLGYVG